MATTVYQPQYTNLIDKGTNKQNLYCVQCPSRILNAGVGTYTEIKFRLPDIRKESDSSGEMCEEKHYWMVNDMYAFENIGFSNTVDDHKYLTCADCEMGPIGWFDQKTKISYIALDRVKYGE